MAKAGAYPSSAPYDHASLKILDKGGSVWQRETLLLIAIGQGSLSEGEGSVRLLKRKRKILLQYEIFTR